MNSSYTAYSPIAIFAYKRLDTLRQLITSLQQNESSRESELFLFSDAAKSVEDEIEIEKVRDYLRSIQGFKNITLKFANENKGLANSIIEGATEILNKYGQIIVLEDDLIVSSNFLDYMNHSLSFYKSNPNVFSISGYTVPIKIPESNEHDNYFTLRSSSWGWATWLNRWENVDWDVKDYNEFISNRSAKRRFNKMGSDLSGMLKKQMEGKISSWAIRWCYHQFKTNQYTSYPVISKIENIGFDANATHTNVDHKRYATPLDVSEKKEFKLNEKVVLNAHFVRQFIAKYSIYTRIYFKIKQIFSSVK